MGAFPLEALPKPLADLAKAAGAAGGFAPEFVAVPGLSVLGASVGHRAVLDLQRTFRVHPIIWTATCAPPGAAKSPGQRIATAPLRKLETQWAQSYEEALERYEADLKDLKKASRADSGGEEDDAPAAAPVRRRCLVGDITIEALAPILQRNSAGGLVWAQPEITSIIGGLDQYRPGGRGAGRSLFLQLHDGDYIQVDRIGRGALYVPEPRVSVTGGIVPERLADLLGGTDGLGARFLVAYLPGAGLALVNLDRNVAPRVTDSWDELIRLMVGDATLTAQEAAEANLTVEVRLSSDAKEVWKRATHAFGKTWRKGKTTSLGHQVIAKASLHLASVALALHVAANPERIAPEVSAETMERAAALIECFLDSALNLDTIGPSAAADLPTRRLDEGVDKLVAWLRRRPKQVARIGQVHGAHVAGCRTADEVGQLLARYAEVYPECVSEGRLPGATSGPQGTIVMAPLPRPGTASTASTHMSKNGVPKGGPRSNHEINTTQKPPPGDKPVEAVEAVPPAPERDGTASPDEPPPADWDQSAAVPEVWEPS